MALVPLNDIKNWFKTNFVPTQQQFWDMFDSFRHKSDKVAATDVDGLNNLLAAKASNTVFQAHTTAENAHAGLFGALRTWVEAQIAGVVIDSTNLGALTPLSIIPDTINVHGFAVEEGTYANCGGVVVPATSYAFISRVAGVWKITVTELDLTEYSKNLDLNLSKKKVFETINYTRSVSVKANEVVLNKELVDFKPGFYLTPSGGEGAFSGYSYTAKLALIKAGVSYNYKGQLGGGASIVFYDKLGVFLSSVQETVTPTDFDFITPVGSVFAKYTVLDSEIPNFEVTALEAYEINSLDDLFSDVENSLESASNALTTANNAFEALESLPGLVVVNQILLDSSANFKTGFYLSPSGGENSFAGYSYTNDFLALKAGVSYNYKGKLGGYSSIVFYDENENVVSSVQSELTDFDFTTPTGTLYGKFTCLDSFLSTFKITALESYFVENNTNNINEVQPVLYGKSYLGNNATEDINTDYAHIISYGQSLSTGTDNADAFTKTAIAGNYMVGTNPYDHVGTAKTGLVCTNAEHFIVSCTNSFSKMYRKFVNKTQLFFASSCGAGGQTISQLSKSGQPYAAGHYENFFLSALTRAKAIAVAEGKTISCPAIIFVQGESDYDPIGSTPSSSDGSKSTYKTRLMQLKNDMQADVISIYGQEAKPMFYLSQVGGDFAKNKNLGICMAQLEFAQENEDVILLNPNYFTPDYEGAHLSINGYRWLGEQCAKTLFQTLIKGEKFKAVFPEKYEIIGNRIYIHFYVPVLPLVFDSKIIADTLPAKGFYVVQDDVSLTISSVAIVNNCVVLELPAELTGVVEVGYGSTFGGSGYGNLRDSDDFNSLYTYADDTLDYSLSNRFGYWETQPYAAGHPDYVPGATYAINELVVFHRIDGNVLLKSLVNGNNTIPCFKIAYRPLSQDGTTLIGKKYPMYNWCNHFYKSIAI